MDITHKVIDIFALPEFIFGAEGEGEATSTGTPADASKSSQESAGGASQDAEGDTEEHEDDDHDDKDDPKVKGLKSALAAERKRANAAERAARAAAKEKEERDLAEKTEIEQLQIKDKKNTERLEKLTAGYRRSALDAAIEKAAKDFTDPADAVAGVDRTQIEVEQDDEDPSIVKVDEKSVIRAVKALAAEKKHWLKPTGTDDGQATGSGFGGSKKTPNEATREQALREKYRL